MCLKTTVIFLMYINFTTFGILRKLPEQQWWKNKCEETHSEKWPFWSRVNNLHSVSKQMHTPPHLLFNHSWWMSYYLDTIHVCVDIEIMLWSILMTGSVRLGRLHRIATSALHSSEKAGGYSTCTSFDRTRGLRCIWKSKYHIWNDKLLQHDVQVNRNFIPVIYRKSAWIYKITITSS